jgi:uncharacterized protein (TIGR03435 family)
MLGKFLAISTVLLASRCVGTSQEITSDGFSSQKLKFEVASVKECLPDQPKAQIPTSRTFPGGLSLGCVNLKTLIQFAFDVFASGKADPLNPGISSTPIEGLPYWAESTQYSIEAKTESPQSAAMMRGPMMQALLEERFGLKVHREKREVPVFLLTVAKSGLKLHETLAGTCVPLDFSEALNMQPAEKPFCALPSGCRRDSLTIWDAHGMTLGSFAKTLHPEGRPVVDETGLNTAFDIHLELGSDAPDQTVTAENTANDPSPGTSLLIKALREQLGLQLSSGRGYGEFLVVDHIEKVGANK